MSSNAMGFEKLLEAVPDALVGMDQKGVIRFVNRQTEWLFGYDRDQLIGEPIETLVPEPLWQIYVQHEENYFADPRTRSSGLELQLSGRHQDGGEFPINVSMSQIDTGDVLLVITAVAEVTQQRLAVKNAGLVGAIVEYSRDAIIGMNREGIVTSWNPAAERMYGYSNVEIVGRFFGLLIPQERSGELTTVLTKVRASEHVEHLQTDRVRKDGTLVPVSIVVSPIRDEDGVVVGAAAVHRDVTEQRQAFENAQRIAAIVKHSTDAIIGRDLDGIITSWNPAAEKMYGYSAEEIVGKRIDRFVPEDQLENADTILARIQAGLQVDQIKSELFRKDGTMVLVTLTISPIRDADGKLVGTSVIHHEESNTGSSSSNPDSDRAIR